MNHFLIDPKRLKKNKPKGYGPYNQDLKYKSKFCSVFANAGAITWNTGMTFTDSELFDKAEQLLASGSGNTVKIAYMMAQSYGLKVYTIPLGSLKAILDKRYAVAVSCRLKSSVYTDGRDGVIDGDYLKKTSEGAGHAMYMVKNRGSYYLCNSYGTVNRSYPLFKVDLDALMYSDALSPYGALIIE